MSKLPQAGTMLGDFELIKVIGKGGFGAVYRAKQHKLAREVAVKVMLPDALKNDVIAVKRFFREIDIVRRLEHPNVTRLFDFGQTDEGLVWMAMELVRGSTLRTAINRGGPMSEARVRRIALQMLSALVHAHELEIIHRDIKPGNVMLTDVGADKDFVKLLDFGIGKVFGGADESDIHQLTRMEQSTYGTPLYMAPEQITGGEVGPLSDMYSAALVIYDMLVGKPAFQGDTAYEIIAFRLANDIKFPKRFEGSALASVLLRALASEPSERFASVRDFHAALSASESAPAVMVPGISEALAQTENVDILSPRLMPSSTGALEANDGPGLAEFQAHQAMFGPALGEEGSSKRSRGRQALQARLLPELEEPATPSASFFSPKVGETGQVPNRRGSAQGDPSKKVVIAHRGPVELDLPDPPTRERTQLPVPSSKAVAPTESKPAPKPQLQVISSQAA
ncbi:MAG: serine/threonine-protein kinase, partial [Myxococcota bacterium]|nr:serine/threonine-protein kinase [Myxococcota bacterium]